MKKLFIMGLAAMGLALTACNSDETVEMAKGKAIGFSSFVDKSTRGAADDVTLTNLGSVELYGWRGDDVLFNKQVLNVDDNGVSSYSPLRYWEAGYTYNFEAIAPKAGVNGVEFAAAKTGGTITFTNNATTDLLYVKAAEKTMDAEIKSAPAEVELNFAHQLARVKFTFKNTFPANAAAKISVKDVKITNAYKKGSITPAAENAKWTVDATNKDLVVAFANSTNTEKAPTNLVAGTGVGETDHMYLIPTADATTEYTVTFTVTLDQNGVTTDYNHTVTFQTEQKQGLSYNYIAEINEKNINPNPNEQLFPIEFTAKVADWGTWSNDVTIMKPAASK